MSAYELGDISHGLVENFTPLEISHHFACMLLILIKIKTPASNRKEDTPDLPQTYGVTINGDVTG